MSKTDAIRLQMLGLPVIKTLLDFSKITHISEYTIYQLSINADKHYRTYAIPKKSGKLRSINQPNKRLKGLQSWILVNILNKLKVSNSCKGFEKGTSIADNAEPHKGSIAVLTIDIENFFPTISRKKVFNIFRSIGYNNIISTILANICTYNGYLPQGSPCSPKLANLSTWQLDVRIQGLVGKRGVTYTRYADDLSFSGLSPAKVVKIIPMVKSIIEDENFKINKAKTRIAGISKAKVITGLVLSEDTYGIGKKKYKKLRSKIHHLTLAGEQANEKLLLEVMGWLSYLNSVDKRRLAKARSYINDLLKKHPATLLNQV